MAEENVLAVIAPPPSRTVKEKEKIEAIDIRRTKDVYEERRLTVTRVRYTST